MPRLLLGNCLKTVVFVCLLVAAVTAKAQPPQKVPTPLRLTGVGRANLPVDGLWKFQTGDNVAWAQPGFDDSNWQPILAGQDWETQGHPEYTGFAWYRRELVLDVKGDNPANWRLGL